MRSRSATSRFCTGAVIAAAARPASSTSVRPVQGDEAGGGGVGRLQAGHGDGEDLAVGLRIEVAQHRAVPGLAHLEHVVGGAADVDALLADGEGRGPSGVA